MTGQNDDDESLWGFFTRGMKKLPRPPLPPGEEEAVRAGKIRKPVPPQPDVPFSPASPLTTTPIAAPPGKFPGTDLDRRTEERLVSGRMPLDGRIDLHGMTQEQAQRALTFFIAESLERGRRTLLVITGKGRGGALATETPPEDWIAPRPGVLRQNMPRWLEAPDIRPHILKIVPAQPRHGGSGAYYIYLRRAR